MARENQTSLLVNLSANVKDFNKKMKNVQGTLKNVSKKMMSIGKTLAMSITAPLVGFGALSIKAFDNQIQVQKQLEVALEANGRQVKALMRITHLLQKKSKQQQQSEMKLFWEC